MGATEVPKDSFVQFLSRGLTLAGLVTSFLGVIFGALYFLHVDWLVSLTASLLVLSVLVLACDVWYHYFRKPPIPPPTSSTVASPAVESAIVFAHPDGRTVTIPSYTPPGATPVVVHAEFTAEGAIAVDTSPPYTNRLAAGARNISLSQMRSREVAELLDSLLSLAMRGMDETTHGILQSLKSKALALTGKQALGVELFWSNWNLSVGDLETHFNRHDRAELAFKQAVLNARVTKIPDLVGIAEGGVGTALGMQGKSAEALQVFERVVQAHPGWPDAWYNKGVALSSLGRKEDALACFAKSTELDPAKQEAWYNQGNCLFALKRFDKAAVAYRRVLELRPNRSEAWNNLGATLLRMDKVEEASAALSKAVALRPAYSEAWANQAVAEVRRGNYAAGLAAVDRAIALGQDNETQFLRKGQILSLLGRHQESVASFDKSIETATDSYAAWLGKANSLFALNEFAKSAEAYRAAIALDATTYEAHYNLGTALGRIDQLAEAIKEFDKALQLDKTNADCWENRGNALFALENYDQALVSYAEAEKLAPSRPSVHVHLGAAALFSGRKEDALREFETAVRLDPTHSMAWYNLGTVHATSDRPEEAIRALAEAWKNRDAFTEGGVGVLLLALQTGLLHRIRSVRAGDDPNDTPNVQVLKAMIQGARSPAVTALVAAFFDEMERGWSVDAGTVRAFRAQIEDSNSPGASASAG